MAPGEAHPVGTGDGGDHESRARLANEVFQRVVLRGILVQGHDPGHPGGVGPVVELGHGALAPPAPGAEQLHQVAPLAQVDSLGAGQLDPGEPHAGLEVGAGHAVGFGGELEEHHGCHHGAHPEDQGRGALPRGGRPALRPPAPGPQQQAQHDGVLDERLARGAFGQSAETAAVDVGLLVPGEAGDRQEQHHQPRGRGQGEAGSPADEEGDAHQDLERSQDQGDRSDPGPRLPADIDELEVGYRLPVEHDGVQGLGRPGHDEEEAHEDAGHRRRWREQRMSGAGGLALGHSGSGLSAVRRTVSVRTLSTIWSKSRRVCPIRSVTSSASSSAPPAPMARARIPAASGSAGRT